MKVKIKVADWLSGKPVTREVEAIESNGLIAITETPEMEGRFVITHLPTGMAIIGPFMRNKAIEAYEQCARVCTAEQGWDFKNTHQIPGRVKDQGRTLRANWSDHVVGGKLR